MTDTTGTIETNDIDRLLADLPPFRYLPADLRERIASGSRRRQYHRHETLIAWAAPPPRHVFLVLSGSIEVVLGEEQASVSRRGPGELVGLSSALAGGHITGWVRAVVDAECLLIPTELLYECMAVPAFAADFGQLMAGRLHHLYNRLSAPPDLPTLQQQPLRGSIGSVMSTPPVTCDPDATAAAAARQMAAARVTSVVVVADGQPVGIVTQRDLITRVMAADRTPQAVTAAQIMSAPLHTVAADTPLYHALLTMVRHRIKHLPVLEGDRLAGLATISDVSRARGSGALAIVEDIEHAATVADLAKTRAAADQVVQALISEGASPLEVLPVVTEFNDRLTRRVLELAEATLLGAGLGSPPCEYVWLTMGSAGRTEQLFRTDQDNAIVYADPPPAATEAADRYFDALARVAVDSLVECGWARCKGDAMATNPLWRKPIAEWEAMLARWFTQPGPDQIMNAHIFLDFRPLHGNFGVAARLRDFVLRQAAEHPALLRIMAETDLEGAVPVGPFGLILTPHWGKHRGQINLKAQASVHVVDCVRLFALRAGIADVSTIGRLRRLVERGDMAKPDADWIAAAYETILDLRFRHFLAALDRGEPPSDQVRLKSLSARDQAALGHALSAVSRLQTLTGHSFRLLFV